MNEEPRAKEGSYLAFTYEFLKASAERGELHPYSFSLMTRQLNARLAQLEYAPFPDTWAAPPPVPPVAPSWSRPAPGHGTAGRGVGLAAAGGPVVMTPSTPATPALTGSQLGLTWALYLGAFFLLLAAVAFTAYSWQSFSDNIKTGLILAYTLSIFGLSVVAERARLKQAADTLFWLAAATVPVTLGAFASFVLRLRIVDPAASFPVGNEWLTFVTAGSGAVALVLYAWKKQIALVYVGLISFLLAPLAWFMRSGELLPAIPAVIALVYSVTHSTVRDEQWKAAVKSVAVVAAALAVVMAMPSVLEHFWHEFAAVHSLQGQVSLSHTPFVCVALLVTVAFVWRRSAWTESMLPEAVLEGLLLALLVMSFRLGAHASPAALAYLAAFAVPLAYLLARHDEEAAASAVLPLVMAMVLVPSGFYARFLQPASGAIVLAEMLPGLALALLAAGLSYALHARGSDWKTTVQVVAFPAGAAAYALGHALAVTVFPYFAVGALLAAVAVAYVALAGYDLFGLSVPAVSAALLVALEFAAWWATAADGREESLWIFALYFGVWALATLALSLRWDRNLAYASASGLLGGLTVVFIAAPLHAEAWVVLAALALMLGAFAALYRNDIFLLLATGCVSLAVISYIDPLPGTLDQGLIMLLLLPPFLAAAALWHNTADEMRKMLLSLDYFMIPVLVLGAAKATGWDAEFTLFILVLIGGSAFAIAGFSRRILGFAVIGVLFTFWASFEFLAPFVALIPSWVGFGAVGVGLILLGIFWERKKQSVKEKVIELGRGWV